MAAKKSAAGGAKKSQSKSGHITAITETVGDDVSRKGLGNLLLQFIPQQLQR